MGAFFDRKFVFVECTSFGPSKDLAKKDPRFLGTPEKRRDRGDGQLVKRWSTPAASGGQPGRGPAAFAARRDGGTRAAARALLSSSRKPGGYGGENTAGALP